MESSTQENIPATRSYQREMLDASLKRNVVIALDTGAGKTHIAVLRIKIECEREPNKRSWFIAPTVSLCEQQREVIASSLPVPVGLISGAQQPDQWTDEKLWRQVLSTHRIIVSTPQVLLDALRHGYVNLGRDIGLLVFDEAHHASSGHPYNMIMREFYDNCLPRPSYDATSEIVRPFVLGLTASPTFGGNVNKAFVKLEKNLDSVIIAPRINQEELKRHVYHPDIKKIMYLPLSYKTDWKRSANTVELAKVVSALNIQEDPTVISLRRQLNTTTDPIKLQRIDQRLSRAIDKGDTFVHKGMHDFLRTAKELCIDIGPWAADWFVYNVINKALTADASEVHALFPDRHQNEKACLIGALQRVKVNAINHDPKLIVRSCSPKANDFIAFLLSEKREFEAQGEVFSGITFITRRDGALALSELLKYHPCTSGTFSVGTLVGSSESNKRNAFLDITRSLLPEKQGTVLADFRLGEKNLVISTAVAEEGIDIQACCSVFRWDLPQNLVSFAQSRGRARRKQSSFILMFEEGGSHEKEIRRFADLEREMKRKYKEDRTRNAQAADEDKMDASQNREFKIESTGAKVTSQSAISHLAHFCNTLRSVFRDDVQPSYDITPPDYPQGYHAVIEAAALQKPLPEYPGPFGARLVLPRLVPPQLRIYTVEESCKTKKEARRQVAFGAYVSLYEAELLNDRLLPLISSFEPLRETAVRELLKQVEGTQGRNNARRRSDPWTTMQASDQDASDPGKWHHSELEIEGLGTFRMFTPWEIPDLDFSSDILHDPEGALRKFAIKPVGPAELSLYEITAARHFTRMLFSALYGGRLEWDDLEFSYLFLPLSNDVNPDDVWEERRAWAEGARLPKSEPASRDHITINAMQFSARYKNADDIFLLRNRHSFYTFKRWREQLGPNEGIIRQRYDRLRNLEIAYPVIEAQELDARVNFLIPPPRNRRSSASVVLLPQFTDVVLDSKRNVLLGLFLPSIMRTVFIKLMAYRFQNSEEELSPVLHQIPLDLIQTALMSPAANAHFSYERLECLGDSVLKLVTCLQLLADHPTWPEGYLAKQKDVVVSNANLAKAAVLKGLHPWIIRRTFSGRKWVPDYTRPANQQSSNAQDDNSIGHEEYLQSPPSPDLNTSEVEQGDDVTQLSTKTLADVVESLIGAAFLSGGYGRASSCIQAFSLHPGGSTKALSESIEGFLKLIPDLARPIPELVNSESILGYTFGRKMLLVEALMHCSSQSDVESMSYERMEFVGDAVLDAVIVEALYRAEEHAKVFSPGEIQARKATLVNMHFLGFVCLQANVEVDSSLPRWNSVLRQAVPTIEKHSIGLARCLMHSNSAMLTELQDSELRFERERAKIEAELDHGTTFPWSSLARLQVPKYLSDIVKSTLGAIYLDSEGNMAVVKNVLTRLGILKVLQRLIHENVDSSHPVARLWEWAAKHQKADTLKYDVSRKDDNITCTLAVDGVRVKTMMERYNGKASEDDIRFRIAEASLPLLIDRYGGV